MFRIEKIDRTYGGQLEELICNIEGSLSDELFWLPIKKEAKDNFFNEEWTCFVGAFDQEKLVAAAALFFNEFEFGETLDTVGVNRADFSSYAEIGRCMVLPEYRGRGLMCSMIASLKEIAIEAEKKYLVATVHPQNMASRRSLENAGMRQIGETVKCGKYPRCIYRLEI